MTATAPDTDTLCRPRLPDPFRLLRAYIVKRLADLQQRMDVNPCGNPCDVDAYRADAFRRAELERLARHCRVPLDLSYPSPFPRGLRPLRISKQTPSL